MTAKRDYTAQVAAAAQWQPPRPQISEAQFQALAAQVAARPGRP